MFSVFLMSIVYFPGISVYLDCIYHVIMCSGNSLDQQVWGNLLSLYLPQCFFCGLSVQWIMLMWNCELLLFGVRYLTEKKKFSLDMRWPTLFRNSINIFFAIFSGATSAIKFRLLYSCFCCFSGKRSLETENSSWQDKLWAMKEKWVNV